MYQAQNAGDLLKNKRRLLGSRLVWINVGSTVFLLGLTSLLTDVSAEMVATTLPLYLLITLRFSPFQVSTMDGIYQGASVLAGMIGGMVSDRSRRPKHVAAAGYGLSAISKLGFLLVGSWTALSGVVFTDRLGKGIRTAPRDAMIAATTRPEQLATAFGVHRAMDTAGAMIGPLLAVAILTVAPQGYDAIFVVSLCVGLVGVAVITLLVRNPGDDKFEPARANTLSTAEAVSFRGMRVLLRRSEFRTLVAVGSALALVTISDGLLYLALQQRLPISSGAFPLLYVLTALSFMTFAIPAGRLADRIGARVIFIFGYVLLACAYAILLLPRINYPLAALMLTLLGGYYAATDGVLPALASRVLPAPLRATGLALLVTGTGLARLLASTLYGTAWTMFGARKALLVFAMGVVVMSTIAWRTMHGDKVT
jgi:MFS family permease